MSLSKKETQITAKEAYDIAQLSVTRIAEQELQKINQNILEHISDGRFGFTAIIRWSSSFYIKKELEARGFEVKKRGADGEMEHIRISWHEIEIEG
jgi:hypothetical protein